MANQNLDKTIQNKELKKELLQIDSLLKDRKFGTALDKAHQLNNAYKESYFVSLKLAEVLEICKEYEKALTLYSQIHKDIQKSGGKSDVKILVGIANCQLYLGHTESATKLAEELYGLMPDYLEILTTLAACRIANKALEDAELLLNKVFKIQPNNHRGRHELARVYLERNQDDQAIELLEKNIRSKEIFGDSIDLWLSTLAKLNRNRYAQEVLAELVKEHPNMVEFVFGYAVLANQAGEITLARPAYERAMELSPNNYRIIYELGVVERTAGNLERSQELIGQALTLKPDNPAALRTYCSDLKLSYGDENFKRLNYAAANLTDFHKVDQIHMHYALAKAYDDVNEIDTAFRHYGIGGMKKRKDENYSDRDAAQMSKIITQVVTHTRLAETNQVGFQDETPVFILGMPRSGTSLMEQILSAHPDIFGAGELKLMTGVLENIQIAQNRLQMNEKDPVFPYDRHATWDMRGQHYVNRIKQLAGDPYLRIVDKMPGNFNFVGLIHAILPKAKIIHSRRHPVETCLSCYRIHFAEGHQWTYNLRELGRFYKRYWDLMTHWRNEFPGVMFEVRYEDNIADVEGQAKKIISHLGLDWNENCLNFYNVDRPVKTASVTQVRKPIYKTSTNRWRKYEKHLAPLLDELGDIVPQYEAEIAHLAGE